MNRALLLSILIFAVAVPVAWRNAHGDDGENSPEKVYRRYFAYRVKLNFEVSKNSAAFDTLHADPDDEQARATLPDERSIDRWDADTEDALDEVQTMWQDDEVALVRARTTTSPGRSDFSENAPRVAILLRYPPPTAVSAPSTWAEEWTRVACASERTSFWNVALDVAPWKEERAILRANPVAAEVAISDRARTACLAAVTKWVATLPHPEPHLVPTIEGRVSLRTVIHTDVGVVVIASFIEADRFPAGDKQSSFSARERFLMISAAKSATDDWSIAPVRRIK